ncbi:MAG: nucleotidyl transferase AbiEii/AbiGii toxin family protein [Candidatus Marinimicrobia bacterium]|nr:nucleotidyl transferase AbiEii/AbiGii toxin family protein [Candidatus Neomarinimicrobiota bacterium]
MNEQLEFVKQIASRLDSAGIAYMLTGSMALAIYALPRMTRDIDLVIECRPEDSEELVKLFEADCYVDAESIRDAVVGRAMFNIIHKEWIIKADFIIRKNHRYRKVEFDRRRQIDIEGPPISVVAPEDLLLSKLQLSQDSGSELQRRDARSIVESVEGLDWSYLEIWAKDLGVWDLLEQLRNE